MKLRVGCRVDDTDKHEFDVNNLLYHKNLLYSGGDDGRIKIWSSDLTKLAEVHAHPCSVYSLAANEDTIFSCSDDGTIKAFELGTLKEKGTLHHEDRTEFWTISYSGGYLYSGDNDGNIKVWKGGKEYYGTFNIAEPVKYMLADGHTLFTAKDTDIIITEVKTEGEHIHYGIENSFMGRGPITLIGSDLFGFTSREERDIIIHENSKKSAFKELSKVEGAHEKIINALAGAKWGDKIVVFSGGWDKQVKKWNIDEDMVKLDCSCDTEIVVNAIAVGDKGEIYVGGGDGHILRMEIE